MLVQYLYSDQSFRSPFLVTYIGVSLFTLWLPANCISKLFCCPEKAKMSTPSAEMTAPTAYQDIPDSAPVTPMAAELAFLEEQGQISQREAEVDHEDLHDHYHDLSHHSHPWTHYDHFRTALWIAPVWFGANWTYNASLQLTSITSSTVLASTGSLFTFLFAVILRDETFGWIKLAGVLFGVTGSILTGLHDRVDAASNTTTNHLRLLQARLGSAEDLNVYRRADFDATFTSEELGDLLGLLSAVGYGAYAVQTRVLCPHNESLYSMQILLGYIGFICMIAMSPIALWQLLIGTESSAGPIDLPLVIFLSLVVKGLFDNVLSDYLWLRAVILTSATVATVGLGLTIPLAFASDIVFWHKTNVLTLESVLGALFVLVGFVLVNLGSADENGQVNQNGTVRYDALPTDQTVMESFPMEMNESTSQIGTELRPVHDLGTNAKT